MFQLIMSQTLLAYPISSSFALANAEGCSLSVVLRDDDDDPVSANVYLTPRSATGLGVADRHRAVYSSSRNAHVFRSLTPGRYTLDINAVGYAPLDLPVTIGGQIESEMRLRLSAPTRTE